MVKTLALAGVFLLCLLMAVLGLLALPVYAWFDRTQAMRVAVAFDQLANTVLRGQPDEMISAKAYRMQYRRWWPMAAIDLLFELAVGQKEHCKDAYEKERQRTQLPDGYSDKQETSP